jgi:hypothetical protein
MHLDAHEPAVGLLRAGVGSRVSRVATISLAGDGIYSVDWVPVVTVRRVGLFSVLTCVDEREHTVLMAYLRLLHSELHMTQEAM